MRVTKFCQMPLPETRPAGMTAQRVTQESSWAVIMPISDTTYFGTSLEKVSSCLPISNLGLQTHSQVGFNLPLTLNAGKLKVLAR